MPCPTQVNAAQGSLDFCHCDHDAVIDLAWSGDIFVHRRVYRVFDKKITACRYSSKSFFNKLDAEGLDIFSSRFANDMSDEFGTRQRAKISILRKISHFRVYFSLALLICLLGLSCSLSLFLYATMSPPLSPSFSRAQTLTRSDLARFSWDASLPWNRVVSGWLWTLFSRNWAERLTGWVTA